MPPPHQHGELSNDTGLGNTTEGGGYGRRVPAADQAIRILLHLARLPGGEATQSDIARSVGVHRSKAHALLNTLLASGFVRRREPGSLYALGPAVLELSRALEEHDDLPGAAGPHLEGLAADTGTTALLGIVTAGNFLIVARREAGDGLAVTIRVGHSYPLTWGAHGKAITAFLSDDRREKVLAEEKLFFRGSPGRSEAELDGIRGELGDVRERGYALDLGSMRAGVRVASAPLVDEQGEPRAAVVAVGTFSEEEAPAIGARVAEAAAGMSPALRPFLNTVTDRT